MRILLLVVLFAVPAFGQDSTWFVNVTEQVGLGSDSLYNYRIYATDVNNDDYPDLLLQYGNWGQNQLRLFLNLEAFGQRVFAEITEICGLNPPGSIADVAVVADFNNDGNVDVVTNVWYHTYVVQNNVCIENPDEAQKTGSGLRIFLGDGTGKFTVRENSGLEKLAPNSGSALPVADFDRDGKLDLYVGSWYTGWCDGGGGQTPDAKYLMKGNGDGTFTDATSASGLEGEANYGLFGANVADFNNDGFADIINTPYDVQGTGNVLKNDGNASFVDVAQDIGFDLHYRAGNNGQAMVPWEAMPYDFDNDGDVDFLVPFVHGSSTSTRGKTCIYVNGGAAANWSLTPDPDRITRKSPQGVSGHYGDHKAVWWDMDNNGLADIVISDGGYGSNFGTTGERLHFCKQDSLHRFTDITKELGFINGTSATTIDTIIKGPHAIEPIDYDLDGDDDLVAGMLYNPVSPFLFLRNDVGTKNNWIKIKLKAPADVNRSAIGARVYVKAGGVTQMRDIEAGQGHFGGQQPFFLTFGLGQTPLIDTIIVRWPDKNLSQTVVPHVFANNAITIDKNGITSEVRDVTTEQLKLSLHPNPAGTTLTVTGNGVLFGNAEVFSMKGDRVLMTAVHDTATFTLPVNALANGVYMLKFVHKIGPPTTSFFIVNK